MKTYSQLSDQEVAEAIAEEMGWTKEINHWWDGETYPYVLEDSDHEVLLGETAWNPRHDLNQCRVFEEWLEKQDHPKIGPSELQEKYSYALRNLVVGRSYYLIEEWFAIIRATPDQRCEAFLKTMGRCK